MRLVTALSVLISMLLISTTSFAQKKSTKGHSSEGASNSGSNSGLYVPDKEVALSSTFGEFSSASGTNGLRASMNYKKFIREGMEVGGRFDLMMVDYKGSSNTYMGLWGTFTYNLHSWDLANTYYATGALGIVDEALAGAAVGASDKKFSFSAFAGRRFPWMDKLYYSPEAGFRKIGGTDLAIVIVPLNVSVLW